MASVEISTRGLLFDMDGVLISSIGSVLRSWRAWARQHDVAGADTLEIPHGTRAIDIVKRLRPEMNALEGLRRIEDLEMADTRDLEVLPGVKTLLQKLPAERWAIVTSATRRLMVARLQAAGLPTPGLIVAADDVVNGKPDPEPYRKGAQLLGFTPGACVVVEDAPSGVGAGKAAGSRVLGVLGTHSAEELRGAGADWVVSSLAGLVAGLEGDDLYLKFEAL